LAAYLNSFDGPCIFDDILSITENLTIRHLWPIGPVLSPPPETTVAGRPLLNLTLAVNYAIGSLNVRGYHAVNLAIHLLAALTLMGVVRRTLEGRRLRDRYGGAAPALAAAVAVVWLLHPLQTESVTYVIQRAESMAALFYLLTLYAVIRAGDAPHMWRWNLLAVTACLLGVASKEVVVTAPLVVLLYDRTFLSGSFREAWRRRRGLYLALACTWLVCAFFMIRNYLLVSAAGHGGTSGFATGMSPWRYALTQTWAITHYLQLTFWPSPLIFDYGTWLADGPGNVWPSALLVVLLLAGTALALWRWPALGFLGAWFFICLAPTSSFVPLASETIAERRMYLALAAPVALVIIGGWTLWCRLWPLRANTNAPPGRRLLRLGIILPLLVLAAALAVTTARRNNDYRSAIDIWQDTFHKRPDNARAPISLGMALADKQQFTQAIACYHIALALEPNSALAHYDLGLALARQGRTDEAIEQYRQTLLIEPHLARPHNDLGVALGTRGQIDEAIEQYRQALALNPDYAEAESNLGAALAGRGEIDQAMAHFQRAIAIDPDYAEAHSNLATALARHGQMDQANAEYQRALQLRPDDAEARNNYAKLLLGRRQIDQAIAQYRLALASQPNFAEAYYNLGNVLKGRGQIDEAIAHYQKALAIKPDYARAHNNLGAALWQQGRTAEAISHFQKALEIQPNFADARRNLEAARAQQR
jgi:tetratricopeptide (TPR) repeat protein